MKILLTAFAFEPCETSEPGAAWRFAELAATEHDVYVLTGGFTGPVQRTRSYLKAHPELRIQAIPFWPRGFPRRAGWRFINVHYWMWQKQLARIAAELHAQVGFDLIHHVTLSRYWIGSSVNKLPVPLIWGPVGSGGNTPRSFAAELPWHAWLPNKAREISASICRRDRMLRDTLKKASVCFATNGDTKKRLLEDGAKRVELLPQICFSEGRLNELASLPAPPDAPPLHILSIGRLVYWKGFQYGIRAAAQLKERGIPFEYHIAGWGPYEAVLRRLISDLGLEDTVTLVGRKTNDEVIHEEMKWAHVLVHPALHESFGNVCLEALAAGRPVVCLDLGGPATQVTTACGFAVPAENPHLAATAMANALQEMATNKKLYLDMASAAKIRARTHFHRDRLATAILGAYKTP